MVEYRKGAISSQELKSILKYDPETGLFTWLAVLGRRSKIGDVAGCLNSGGYIVIKINYDKYLAHRLAWFYMTGKWPDDEIDHKDGVTDNNEWDNLREAIHAQNCKNRKLNANSSTGLKGVYKRGRRWRSKISIEGIQTNLGTFDTAEEAYSAYIKAADIHHGEFTRKGDCHGGI